MNKLKLNWFPEAQNGNKKGLLNGQSGPKVMGANSTYFTFYIMFCLNPAERGFNQRNETNHDSF